MAYLYCDNYPSNEVDIPHNSQSLTCRGKCPRRHRQRESRAAWREQAVTLIGCNCPASRVGRCVDCEGGHTAQIFSDCTFFMHNH